MLSDKEKLDKDWLLRYTLTPEQRKKLIEDKIRRAIEQSKQKAPLGFGG